MKGDIMRKILEQIAETPAVLEDLLVIMTSPYGASQGGVERRLSAHRRMKEKALSARIHRRQLYNVIYELRKQKLISKKSGGEGGIYTCTKRGIEKLMHLQALKKRALPEHIYVAKQEKDIKIIVFDIPEKERRKRAWLRVVLKRIGFQMVQKSVWIGKSAIPEDFIRDVDRLSLLPYVKILAVTKTGNLTPLV